MRHLHPIKSGLSAVALAVASLGAHADLARVGPANLPSPAGHGFPLWYQDLNGLALDLCLPNVTDPGSLQMTVCLQTTPAPYTFPTTFPGESFYFRATTPGLAMPGGKSAVLVLGLEATFNAGVPTVNDQVTFSRIRITAGVPERGLYTVTHPYGENTFEVDAVGQGNRDIVYTDDVGLATGNFSGALRSRLGPFLRAADPATGAALPPVTINGVQFLADIDPVSVTGSPFGTNFFRICGKRADGTDIVLGGFGPSGTCAETGLFTLTGRLHDMVASPIGTPLKVESATYARNASGTHVNVSASAGRVLATQPLPLLTAASPQTPPVRMVGPNGVDRYFTQGFTDPTGTLPSQVIVTNSADVPPTSVYAATRDVVSIVSTTYDAAAQTLTVVATSSDKGFNNGILIDSPPSLVLEGVALPQTTVTPGGIAGDPASVTIVATGVSVPPAEVSVLSSAGGIGRVALASPATTTYAPGSPYALDDRLVTFAGAPAQTINVLANDLAHAAAPIDPASVALLAPGLTPASLGTVVRNLDGSFTFTSNGAAGTATFKYTVNATGVTGPSNVATVTIEAGEPPGGFLPRSVADGPVRTLVNDTQNIRVLANDSGNGGVLDPASVEIVAGSVVGGTATVLADGSVNFLGGAAANAGAGFDYTVANTNGNRTTPTHVSAPVILTEGVAVTAGATCTRSTRRWRLDGTGMSPNTTVTLYNTSTVPAAPTATNTVGTVTSNAAGAFTFDVISTAACASRASLRTQTHTNRNNIAITIR